MWRVQDQNNYYVARFNPLEDNFRIYIGERIVLASDRVTLNKNIWHTLLVRHINDHIEGYLNNRKLLDLRENTLDSAGKIGLWTKADALTGFDNLRIKTGF